MTLRISLQVLRGCRHPCVERMDRVAFIKNDIELGRSDGALQIVTGPNMGGKSTYIRSVGVNVLLAQARAERCTAPAALTSRVPSLRARRRAAAAQVGQSIAMLCYTMLCCAMQVGCFVACDSAEISPVDAILARVGAGDMQVHRKEIVLCCLALAQLCPRLRSHVCSRLCSRLRSRAASPPSWPRCSRPRRSSRTRRPPRSSSSTSWDAARRARAQPERRTPPACEQRLPPPSKEHPPFPSEHALGAAGTSTYDGFGLAWAISEHLATRVGCVGLFATHFHELTALSAKLPGRVVNKHVSAHVDGAGQLAMLYRVEDGPSDQSFGVHVAAAAGFPPQVVAEAKEKLADLEDDGVDGGKRAADGPAGGTPKRVRAAISEAQREEGMTQVRRSLKSFTELPLDTLAADDAAARLGEIRAELRASANPLVARLCEQAAGGGA